MRLVRGLLVAGLLMCPAMGLFAQISPFYDPGFLYQPCDPANPDFWFSYQAYCMPMNYGYGGYFISPSQTYYLRQYNHQHHGLNNYSGISDFRRAYTLHGPRAMEGLKLGNGYSVHAIDNRGPHGQHSTSLVARGTDGAYPIGSVGRNGHFESAARGVGSGSALRGAVAGTTMTGSAHPGQSGGFHGAGGMNGGGRVGGAGMGGAGRMGGGGSMGGGMRGGGGGGSGGGSGSGGGARGGSGGGGHR